MASGITSTPPPSSFSSVRHGGNYGTLKFTTRFLLFEAMEGGGGNETNGKKRVKLSLTNIAKHQKSPAKNTSVSKLRIIGHDDDRTKIFEFDSREELVQADKKLTELRREIQQNHEKKPVVGLRDTPPRNTKGGAPVGNKSENNEGKKDSNTSNSNSNSNINKSTKNDRKKTTTGKTEKKPASPDASAASDPTTDNNNNKNDNNNSSITKKKNQEQKKTMTTHKIEEQSKQGQMLDPKSSDPEKGEIVAAVAVPAASDTTGRPQQSSKFSFYSTMARLYIRVWSYTLICIILAIAGTIASGSFRQSCFIMEIQLQNLKTGEPIEGTQRGYGFTAREIEPGEQPDYRNCRGYTRVEEDDTFNDEPFLTGDQASQNALVYGSILCVLILLGTTLIYWIPYTTAQKCSIRWLLILFCFSAIVSQASSFQIFQTDFCQTHLCKKGPGVGSAVFAIFMWILLLLVLLLGPGFIPL